MVVVLLSSRVGLREKEPAAVAPGMAFIVVHNRVVYEQSTKGSESNAAAFVSSKLVSALLLSLVLLLVLQARPVVALVAAAGPTFLL